MTKEFRDFLLILGALAALLAAIGLKVVGNELEKLEARVQAIEHSAAQKAPSTLKTTNSASCPESDPTLVMKEIFPVPSVLVDLCPDVNSLSCKKGYRVEWLGQTTFSFSCVQEEKR
jgi:hypothetical protein